MLELLNYGIIETKEKKNYSWMRWNKLLLSHKLSLMFYSMNKIHVSKNLFFIISY